MRLRLVTATALAVTLMFAQNKPTPANVLYTHDDVVVTTSETQDAIDFGIRAPDTVNVSIRVDRNQNAMLDSRVDTAYSLTPAEHICTVFLLGIGATTRCGEFTSDAQLNMRHDEGFREYTYIVSKAELSFEGRSAWVALEIFDKKRKSVLFVPTEDFKKSTHIKYQIK